MKTETINFDLPIMNEKGSHFTDLYISAKFNIDKNKILNIEIINICYFPGNSSMGSNLVDLIPNCAPELFEEIKKASLNNFRNKHEYISFSTEQKITS